MTKSDENSAWSKLAKPIIESDNSTSQIAREYREKYGCKECGRVVEYDSDKCQCCGAKNPLSEKDWKQS